MGALAAVLVPGAVALAQFEKFKETSKDERHATCALIADVSTLTPGGSATLGLAFTIQPKWHIYWNGRNDSGTEPTAEWKVPPGVTIEPMLWPAPKRHVLPGDILDHVYENQVILLVPVRIAETVKPGQSLTLTTKVQWLVCDEACVPEEAELSITLPVGKLGDAAKPSADDARLRQARTALPVPLSQKAPEATVAIKPAQDGDGYTAVITAANSAAGARELKFYPLADSVQVADPIASCVAKGSSLTLRLGQATDERKSLKGVLAVTGFESPQNKAVVTHFLIDVPVQQVGTLPSAQPQKK